MKKVKTRSEEELIKLAFDFSSFLKGNEVISLKGELGAGKTTFVKGIAKQMGIKEVVTSPTYTIIKEYEKKLCHIDAYRVFKEDIGLDYYIKNNYLIFIEWAENLEDINFDYEIKIDYIEDGREVSIIDCR